MSYRHGPVVVGADGSPHSLGALRWAADEACRHTLMLHVVTVLPAGAEPRPGSADVAEAAAAEARRWRVGVAAVAETRRGAPVEVLRDLADQARLVVVGGRGADGSDRPMGSVSRALGTRCAAPVLIVHDGQRWAAPDAALPRTAPVVTGFDGSDSARRALPLAFEEAAARGVRLVIMQAWPHPDLWRPGEARGCDLSAYERMVRESLRAAAAPWRAKFPHVDVEIRSEPGEAAPALATASQWAGLLVVGARCPADPDQADDPPVAGRVLQYAACPVLVAHGPATVPAVAPAVTGR